jgi:hypothetical protein
MKIREALEVLKFTQEVLIWNKEVKNFISFPLPLDLSIDLIGMMLRLAVERASDLDYDLEHISFSAGTLRMGPVLQ